MLVLQTYGCFCVNRQRQPIQGLFFNDPIVIRCPTVSSQRLEFWEFEKVCRRYLYNMFQVNSVQIR